MLFITWKIIEITIHITGETATGMKEKIILSVVAGIHIDSIDMYIYIYTYVALEG